MRFRHVFATLFVLAATGISAPAHAAMNNDPDWPCIQRKVPELSMGQIWTGQEIPESARQWQADDDIVGIVDDVAPRRVKLEDAKSEIRKFAQGLPPEQRTGKLLALVQGLFDHMDHERSQVISGIGRYARGQLAMAQSLRQEAAAVDALRAKADADFNEVTARSDRLAFQTRIFEERVQALTYVCEVPTLIEQRLYQLAKTVAESMPAN